MKRINIILSFLKFIGEKFNIVREEDLVEEAIIIEENILRK
jgi:hypothetical protein